MMKKRTVNLLTALALAACLGLSACGSASPAPEASAETAESPAPEAEEAAAAEEPSDEEAAPAEEAAAEEAAPEAEAAAEEAAPEAEGTVTITDHADRTVTVPTDPTRVVILDILPLPAALTVYLDSAETIVAMQPASMNAAKNGILSELYPEILNVSTDIMSGDDVNVEALMALDPQIVYYNAGNSALAEKLDNAGLTSVAVSPTK